jgi:hypothetical protein
MRLWGNTDEASGDAPAPVKKPSGFEGMVLQFLTSNPELKATIESFTTGLHGFAINQQAILTELRAVRAHQLGAGDDVRCPHCGERYSVSGSGGNISDSGGSGDTGQHGERASG